MGRRKRSWKPAKPGTTRSAVSTCGLYAVENQSRSRTMGPPIAGSVAALLHFHGPHEVVGENEVGGGWVEMHIRDVDAVDEIRVLQPRGATDVHGVAREVARVRVRQERDDGTVITADRQGVVGGRVHVGPDGCARRIDR